MSSQIKFFTKNKIDLSVDNVTISVTDSVATDVGTNFVDFVRNRNNRSAWITTGSTDAGTTTMTIDMTDERDIEEILLIKHNLKAYTIKYWNGASFVDFSTPVAETTNIATTNNHSFDLVTTSMIEIVITGAQVVDADKFIHQIILTTNHSSGQLEGWPQLKRPRQNTNKRTRNMLSGKVNVIESIGGFSVQMEVSNWSIDADLTLVEEIYFGKRAVLVWLCGGDEAQFANQRFGYRLEDLFFMRATNDYSPEYNVGIYTNGLKVKLNMMEAIN